MASLAMTRIVAPPPSRSPRARRACRPLRRRPTPRCPRRARRRCRLRLRRRLRRRRRRDGLLQTQSCFSRPPPPAADRLAAAARPVSAGQRSASLTENAGPAARHRPSAWARHGRPPTPPRTLAARVLRRRHRDRPPPQPGRSFWARPAPARVGRVAGSHGSRVAKNVRARRGRGAPNSSGRTKFVGSHPVARWQKNTQRSRTVDMTSDIPIVVRLS